jgi:hypothetical protein
MPDHQHIWIVQREAGGIRWPIRDWEVAKVYWKAGWRVERTLVSHSTTRQ